MPRKVKMRVHAGRPVPMHVTGAPTLAMAVSGGGGAALPAYPGPYTVVPEAWFEQTFPTAGKRMTQDLTVDAVPYLLTSNESGGYTATIG